MDDLRTGILDIRRFARPRARTMVGCAGCQVDVLDTGDALIFLIQKAAAGYVRLPLRHVDPSERADWRAYVAARAPVRVVAPRR